MFKRYYRENYSKIRPIVAQRKQQRYYAVIRGRVPGVYASKKEVEKQTKGFSGQYYKGYRTRSEALYALAVAKKNGDVKAQSD